MGLTWYVKRARRMSAREIGVKLFQHAYAPFIARKLARSTETAILRQDTRLPFELANLEDLYVPDIVNVAERVKRGERWVLGLGWVGSEQWDWCSDPGTGMYWPAIPSHRIDYRKPGTEIRLTWELNRFHDLTVMSQAFHVSRDVSYLAEIERRFGDWVARNPVGTGPNWVSAMEAAIRIVNMTWVARLVHRYRPRLVEKIGHQIAIHEGYISHHLSLGSSANNHLLLELMGLAFAHAFWNFPTKPEKTEDYVGRFTAELDRQTGPGGMNREMSSHYHVFAAESAVHVLCAARARSLEPEKLTEVLGRMRVVVQALTIKEGICRFGDDDEGQIVRIVGPTDKWEHVLAGMGTSPWLLLDPVSPEEPSSLQVFDGVVVIRQGSYRVVTDGGSAGLGPLYAHAHDDGGSIYIGYEGHWFVEDAGTGAYFRDVSLRKSLAEAGAHNGPSCPCKQGRMDGPFTWERTPLEFKVAQTSKDREQGRFRVVLAEGTSHLRRTITVSPSGIGIQDRCRGEPLTVTVTIPASWAASTGESDEWVFTRQHTRISLRWKGEAPTLSQVSTPRFGGGNDLGWQLTWRKSELLEWGIVSC